MQLNRVQDCNDSGLKAKHDVTIVVWSVLKRSYATLQLVEDVDGAWLFSSSVVDHHKRAILVVLPSEDKLFRDNFLVLLVDVIDSVAPLQPGEDRQVDRFDAMCARVEHHSSQIDLCHNSTSFVEDDDSGIV